MSITVYDDIVFRHGVISAGVRGKEVRKNDRTTTASGIKSVNLGWTRTLREYEIATIPLERADWDYIKAIYEITGAGAFGFLLEDPTDFKTTSTTAHVETTGVMASLGGGTYQLYKRYLHIESGRYSDRKITRPQETGFQAYTAGGSTLTGTVDPETGIATISGTPATWVGRFYVPVHFQRDEVDWTLEASGPEEVRLWSGPSVVLEEIPE
jgi:uncharacterized protein (TIGR02217 family)